MNLGAFDKAKKQILDLLDGFDFEVIKANYLYGAYANIRVGCFLFEIAALNGRFMLTGKKGSGREVAYGIGISIDDVNEKIRLAIS